MKKRRLLSLMFLGTLGGVAVVLVVGGVLYLQAFTTVFQDCESMAVRARWMHMPFLRLSDEQWNRLGDRVLTEYLESSPAVLEGERHLAVLRPAPWPNRYEPQRQQNGLDVVEWADIEAVAQEQGRCPFIGFGTGVWLWTFTSVRVRVGFDVYYRQPSGHDEDPSVYTVTRHRGEKHYRVFECSPTGGDWECVAYDRGDI